MGRSEIRQITRISAHNAQLWAQMRPDEIPSTIPMTRELEILAREAQTVLDVGCGSGQLTRAMYEIGPRQVLGVDINSAATLVAGSTSQGFAGLEFKVLDACASCLGTPFGLICLNAVIGCVIEETARVELLRHVKSSLDKDGVVYVADFLQTWSDNQYRERYQEGSRLLGDEGTFAVKSDCGTILYYAHHLTEREFADLCQQAGLRIRTFQYREFPTRSRHLIHGFTATLRLE